MSIAQQSADGSKQAAHSKLNAKKLKKSSHWIIPIAEIQRIEEERKKVS